MENYGIYKNRYNGETAIFVYPVDQEYALGGWNIMDWLCEEPPTWIDDEIDPDEWNFYGDTVTVTDDEEVFLRIVDTDSEKDWLRDRIEF